MGFSSGDAVYVVPARKNGVVLQEQREGIYTVLIGSMQMRCRETELRPGRKPARGNERAAQLPERNPRRAVSSVDLHGLSVTEALRRVEDSINECVLAGAERLEVIHGIGTGRVRNAVRERLAAIPAVRRFSADNANPGTTWVYFG